MLFLRQPVERCYRQFGQREVTMTEPDVPRQFSMVRFCFDRLPVEYHEKYPFSPAGLCIFFGEIPNMPGHCVVADHRTGRVYSGYHTENFAELADDEVAVT